MKIDNFTSFVLINHVSDLTCILKNNYYCFGNQYYQGFLLIIPSAIFSEIWAMIFDKISMFGWTTIFWEQLRWICMAFHLSSKLILIYIILRVIFWSQRIYFEKWMNVHEKMAKRPLIRQVISRFLKNLENYYVQIYILRWRIKKNSV